MLVQRQFDRESGFHIDRKFLSYTIALVAFLLLLLATAPSAQAQGRCRAYDAGLYVRMSGGYITGSYNFFRENSCTHLSDWWTNFGKYGAVDEVDRQAAIRSCIRHTGISDMSVSPSGALFWSCRPNKGSSGGSGGGTRGSASHRKPEIQASKLPLGGVKVTAELGLNSGIQFQRFDHYAVGVQAVADRGILDVVNVWGQAWQNFEVCFPQAGAIVFLDASTSPRSLVDVKSFVRDGYTCGAMNRAGTMVLVKGTSPAQSSKSLAQEFIDSTTDEVSSAIRLDNCSVSSAHNLNLREEPWGVKITVLPKNTTVSATARTESWYRVLFTAVEAEGDEAETSAEAIEGWISAWLSQDDGDCEWQSDDEENPALASSDTAPDDELSIASLARRPGL